MADGDRRGYLDPTLFDKLVADHEIGGMRGEEIEDLELRRDTLTYFNVPKLERFNEAALRSTVRRELAWLFNTTCFGSTVDLTDYPEVRSSVLNYGVPDLAGRAVTGRLIQARARDIRAAILAFEPRIDRDSLEVRPVDQVEKENAITFVIAGDVTSAVRAIPVKFRTDVEVDTAVASVRE